MTKTYGKQQAAPEVVAEGPDTASALVLDTQGPGNSLGLAPVKRPASVPGPCDASRWPGLADAFKFANDTLAAHPSRPALGERHLWLYDLGAIPEAALPSHLLHGLQDARAAEKWLGHFYPGKQLGRESGPKIGADGTVSWAGTSLDPEDDAEQTHDGRQRRQQDREAFAQTLAVHRRVVPAVAAFLGLAGGSPNPTVQGRTWLCTWPTVIATPDGGTAMRNEAALVVAPPGVLLHAGAELLLTTAWDLGAEDRDEFATQLQTAGLRLSEAQRLVWGPALHEVGRVYWMIDPEPAQAAKPKKSKKPKPEPPEPD